MDAVAMPQPNGNGHGPLLPLVSKGTMNLVPRGQEYAAFIHTLRWRVKNNWDNIWVIDGPEGSGKSTLGVTALHDIHKVLGYPAPDPRDVIFDWDDWDRVYSYRQKGLCYLIDEGGDILLNLDWNTSGMRSMRKLLMKARQLNATIIICIPSLWDLDKYVREKRARWRTYVEDRGYAVMQERQTDWRKAETWFEDIFKIGDREQRRHGWDSLEKKYPDYNGVYLDRKWAALQATDPGQRDSDLEGMVKAIRPVAPPRRKS